MSGYNELKNAIRRVVKTNNNREITGQNLQSTLTSMVNSLGANYHFAGFASPDTNPGTPDQNIFYIASEEGTYVNFGGINLAPGLSFLMWNGRWSSETISVGEVTKSWVQQNYVSIAFFNELFEIYNDSTKIAVNDTIPVDKDKLNIKAMFGFWTEQYISALGKNDSGDSGSGVDMATVWSALAGSTDEQINKSHLTTALSGYATISWVSQNFATIVSIPTKLSQLTNDAGFITSAALPTKLSQLANDTGFITSAALPTKVSQLVNDAGYVTASIVNGYATQSWVSQNYVSVEFFERLFQAYSGTTKVDTNSTSAIDNIKAMFGFWTEQYISALGKNDSGGSGSGVDMATVWSALAGSTDEQINKSHLTTALSGYATISWVSQNFATIVSIPTKLSQLANDTGFITSAALPTKLSQLANDTGFITSAALPTKLSQFVNDAGYATQSWVSQNFATIASIPTKLSQLANDTGFITSSALPTKVSQLVNDAGYVTASIVNGYATQSWVSQNYVSVEFFERLFQAYSGTTKVDTNSTSAIDNIKAMFGFWTEQYISALGKNDSGGSGSGVDMATVWSALAGSTDEQINKSHLTTALSEYATQSWVSQIFATITSIPTKLSQLANDTGFITSAALPTKVSQLVNDAGYVTASIVNGYATQSWVSNNYLPLSGGAMTGALHFANYTWNNVGDDVQIGDHNVAGALGLLGINGNTRIDFCQYGNPSNYKSIVFDGTTLSIDGNCNYASTAGIANSVAWSNVSGRPTSMPASDVYAWAKAATKPNYTYDEINLKTPVDAADYTRVVIALCEVTELYAAGKGAFSSGEILYYRYNGLNPIEYARVNFIDAYSLNYDATYSLETSFENESKDKPITNLNTHHGFRKCTFVYNGKHYAGVEAYFVQAAPYFWRGNSYRCTVFGVIVEERGIVKNEEIYNSLSYDGQNRSGISFGNVRADSFAKKDSSDSYVLLGGGGHSLVSSLSVATATKLQTARTIWGQHFDGTSNVDGILTIGVTEGAVIRWGPDTNYYLGSNTTANFYIWGRNNADFIIGTSDAERIRVTGSGNVGIDTTSPRAKLDICGVDSSVIIGKTTGSPGSSTARKMRLGLATAAHTGSECWAFSIDDRNGSHSLLQIGYTASDISRMLVIHNNGSVGVGFTGNSAPSYTLDVSGVIHSTTGIFSDGYVSALGQNTSSDIRKKDIKENFTLNISKIASAPSIKYLWKSSEDKGLQVGSIAQYWQNVLPEAVHEDNDGYLTMQYGVIALLASISTARNVQNHEHRIKELEKECERLRTEVEQLRA